MCCCFFGWTCVEVSVIYYHDMNVSLIYLYLNGEFSSRPPLNNSFPFILRCYLFHKPYAFGCIFTSQWWSLQYYGCNWFIHSIWQNNHILYIFLLSQRIMPEFSLHTTNHTYTQFTIRKCIQNTTKGSLNTSSQYHASESSHNLVLS